MYNFIKRFFDIISSIIALIMLFPLLAIIVTVLRLTGEGEVFYLQQRVGFKNKVFMIYKFATMLKDSSKMNGGYITLKNDTRVTPFGRFLRKTKINELPQLINVILGHMSIVGPRPVMNVSFDSYPKNVKNSIYNTKPGLTGIGSIIFRDEETLITNQKVLGKNIWDFYKNKIYPFKGELEIWYQKNKSFELDLKLILITIWVIFFPNSNIIYHSFNNLPKRNF